MIKPTSPRIGFFFKALVICLGCLPLITGCSTNPATGKKQFTALMSPAQENEVGAAEHKKIAVQYGFYDNQAVQAYVQEVGARVTQNTERPDVQYKFFVIDSPIVNAFALPGGYVYVSRGLLALADNEAELAAVLAHETGHITARHSAERYSHSVLTSLGAAVISAAVDSGGVSQALGLGSNLYLSSYSRSQENEADTLGLRYMTRGGYDAGAMAGFLDSLRRETALESRLEGREQQPGASYLSTHPATEERVAKTAAEAAQYKQGGTTNHDRYLDVMRGLIYGDSPRQGYVRGQGFFHPGMGFGFEAPAGYRIVNQPAQVVAASRNSGVIMVFDLVSNKGQGDPLSYMTGSWMKGEPLDKPERVTIGGMPAATASFAGSVNGRKMNIRVVAIQWSDKQMARFQIGIPDGVSGDELNAIKTTTYSFHRLSDQEKSSLKPYKIEIVTAGPGDTAASLARRQAVRELQEEYFRVYNEIKPGQEIQAGRRYKLIVE